MSTSNGNGGVHLLNDHRAPKPTKAEQEAAAIAQVDAKVRAIATEVAEHYMAQVPGLVAHMLGEFLHANGMTLKAPASWASTPAVGPTTADQSGDAAVSESSPPPALITFRMDELSPEQLAVLQGMRKEKPDGASCSRVGVHHTN